MSFLSRKRRNASVNFHSIYFSDLSQAGKPVSMEHRELRLIQSRKDIEDPDLCITAVDLWVAIKSAAVLRNLPCDWIIYLGHLYNLLLVCDVVDFKRYVFDPALVKLWDFQPSVFLILEEEIIYHRQSTVQPNILNS